MKKLFFIATVLLSALLLGSATESLDQEAVRVISASPKWKPARHNGEPVAVTYVFPVVFKLN